MRARRSSEEDIAREVAAFLGTCSGPLLPPPPEPGLVLAALPHGPPGTELVALPQPSFGGFEPLPKLRMPGHGRAAAPGAASRPAPGGGRGACWLDEGACLIAQARALLGAAADSATQAAEQPGHAQPPRLAGLPGPEAGQPVGRHAGGCGAVEDRRTVSICPDAAAAARHAQAASASPPRAGTYVAAGARTRDAETLARQIQALHAAPAAACTVRISLA